MDKVILIEDLGKMPISKKSSEKRAFGKFKCFCGKIFKAQIRNVNSKNTKSCGCLQRERVSEVRKKHGFSGSRLYNIYYHMKNRCYNKNFSQFSDWGGKGVKVCTEWLDSFENFKNWALSNGYNKHLSIDRIDNNGNYEPSNCRWVDNFIQASNRKLLMKNNTSGYRGAYYLKARKKWCSKISVNNKQIYLGQYSTAEEAGEAYDKYVLENDLKRPMNKNMAQKGVILPEFPNRDKL